MKYLLAIATLLLATGTAHTTEDGCAVVLRTRDGFLNVRAQANAHSRILKRFKPGEIILTDNAGGGDSKWTHVYLGSGQRWGWVRNHFILDVPGGAQDTDCEPKP